MAVGWSRPSRVLLGRKVQAMDIVSGVADIEGESNWCQFADESLTRHQAKLQARSMHGGLCLTSCHCTTAARLLSLNSQATVAASKKGFATASGTITVR